MPGIVLKWNNLEDAFGGMGKLRSDRRRFVFLEGFCCHPSAGDSYFSVAPVWSAGEPKVKDLHTIKIVRVGL